MRLNRWPVLVMILASSCTPQLRAALLSSEAHQRILRTPTPLQVDLQKVRLYLESLDIVGLVCLRFTEPCLLEGATFSSSKLSFCLVRGNKVSCFVAESAADGVLISPRGKTRRQTSIWELEQLMKRFDPGALALLESEIGDEVDSRMEGDSREVGAWSFTGSAGVLFGIPNGPSPSLSVRLGARRWLSPYLLVSLAPGYERRLFTVPGTARDSVSLTGKIEFSWFDEDARKMARRLNLPLLSGFFGMTTSLGLFPGEITTSQRAFAGVHLLFLFLEAGVAVGGAPGASPSFYLAVGLGV